MVKSFLSLLLLFAVLVSATVVYSQEATPPKDYPRENRLIPKSKITIPDFRDWDVLKSEKIEHPTDKKLSAIIQKLKNPDDTEWIIVEKITDEEAGDSWQKALFFQFEPRKNQIGIKMLNVYHIFLNSREWNDKWFLNRRGMAIGFENSDFHSLIDNFYDDCVTGLKNLPQDDPIFQKASQPLGWIFYIQFLTQDCKILEMC